MGDTFIGTEHQLLGFLRDGDSLAARVLTAHGLDSERVRQAILDMRAEEAAPAGNP